VCKSPLYLDIGCGKRQVKKKEGYIGIDKNPNVNPDVVRDIEKGLPFCDNSVDGIFTSHTLEHIEDLVFVMEEMWRVCKPGAKIEIRVPHYKEIGAWRDPLHKRFFTEQTFQYFCGYPDKYLGYDFKCRFRIVKQEVSRDVHVILEVVK